MSDKYTDVAFGKVDVDDNPGSAGNFKISAVPTFILSAGEKAIETFSGADQNKLEDNIKALQNR